MMIQRARGANGERRIRTRKDRISKLGVQRSGFRVLCELCGPLRLCVEYVISPKGLILNAKAQSSQRTLNSKLSPEDLRQLLWGNYLELIVSAVARAFVFAPSSKLR